MSKRSKGFFLFYDDKGRKNDCRFNLEIKKGLYSAEKNKALQKTVFKKGLKATFSRKKVIEAVNKIDLKIPKNYIVGYKKLHHSLTIFVYK